MRKFMLSLAAVTALAYAPSLGNDFQAHDDTLLITQNPTAQGLTFDNIGAAFTTFDPELYIPITLLTYQVEYSLFGLNSFDFHLTNLLLHIGSSILLILIVYSIVKDRLGYPEIIALGTGALFALHPLNTEAVAWAAARKDILSGFFFFASLWAYLQIDSRKKWYSISLVLFALGLMSKVSIIILPLILLLVEEFCGRRKGSLKRTAPFFGLSLIFGIVAILGKQQQISELTLVDQGLLLCKSIAFFVWKFIWPSGLTLNYDQYTPITLLRAEFYLAAIFVILLVAIGFLMRKKNKVITMGIAWFLVCLAPSFATFWKNGMIFYASDRYNYIAIVGLCLLVMSLVAPYLHRYKALGAIVCALLIALTMKQSLTWKDTVTTYERSVKLNPRPVLQLNNLGTHYFQTDDIPMALEMYLKALSYDQLMPQILINIGLVQRKEQNDKEALLWFERSTKMTPSNRSVLESDTNGYYFLGTYQEQYGDIEKSFETFEAAVKYAPQFASTHLNLGIMYQKYKRVAEAKSSFLAAVNIDKNSLDARYRLAALQAETGEFVEAIENLEYVVKNDANYEQAAKHLEQLRKMVR